jgi:hypothetical protein
MKRARNALFLIIGTSCVSIAAVTLRRAVSEQQEQPSPAASERPPPAPKGPDVHPPVPDEDWTVIFFEPLPDGQVYPVNKSPEAYEIRCADYGALPDVKRRSRLLGKLSPESGRPCNHVHGDVSRAREP